MDVKPVSSIKDVKQIELKGMHVGGVVLQGEGFLRVSMTGALGQLTELNLKKGYFHPKHRHHGEESIGYVIKGHLRMGIGNEEYVLGAGDSWCHPDGIFHWTKAIEDTHAVEIHCPPRPAKAYNKEK